jgi:hypothetical protein
MKLIPQSAITSESAPLDHHAQYLGGYSESLGLEITCHYLGYLQPRILRGYFPLSEIVDFSITYHLFLSYELSAVSCQL